MEGERGEGETRNLLLSTDALNLLHGGAIIPPRPCAAYFDGEFIKNGLTFKPVGVKRP